MIPKVKNAIQGHLNVKFIFPDFVFYAKQRNS